MACPHCSPIKGVKLTPAETKFARIVNSSPGITVTAITERMGINDYRTTQVHASNIRRKLLGTDWCLSFGFGGYTLTRGLRRSSEADPLLSDSPPRSTPAGGPSAAGEAAAHLLSLAC